MSAASSMATSRNWMRKLSLIDESGERRVRMAYLAVVASHSINGVLGSRTRS